MPEIAVLLPEGVGVAGYALPGSSALAAATVEQLRRHRVVIWEKHGVLAAERDLRSAFDLVDMLDKAAHVALACLAAGSMPRGLTDAEVDDLRGLARRS
jgi:rhamnulose-1-phosphate aldolase